MFRFLAPCGLAFAPLFAVATGSASAAASAWTQQPTYPQTPGMAGIIAGAHAGVLIAAGGANFPDKMPWDGGKKIYYDEIFALAPGDTAWRSAGKLPAGRAYSAVVSTAEGIWVIGGENSEHVFQDTLLLRWDGKTVLVGAGPELPAPRTSAVATWLDGSLYVAGGYAPGMVRLSSGDFWQLDLAERERHWQVLPTWPGPTRAQAVMAALEGAVYLFSGLEMTIDAEGKAKPNYLGDAYRYRADRWERLPDMPWSAIAAPSPAPVTVAPARVYVLGGVDSRLVGKVPRETRVPDHMMYFDVVSQQWITLAARWPDPVVTSPAVAFAGEWWIVSGEIMAGVRTKNVWSWRPEFTR